MRILIADDHKMMRDGLRAILEKEGIEVVGEATTGREAIQLLGALRPDIVIMDIAMPELNGIDATRQIRSAHPEIRVIALSMNDDRRYVIAMLEAGASWYLLKNMAAEELLRAVHAVHEGGTYLGPAISKQVVEHALKGVGRAENSARPLTPREREVLQLIAEGKSSKEIAARLSIAVPTVETHRRQLMDKLQLRSIAELTKYAIREGLTSG